jgi:polyisoprenoid-binding protein YceI
MRACAATAFLAVILAAWPARAAHWNVDYAKSRLGFTVQWSNEPFSAMFKRWNADIDFDPNDLAHAHASVTVDLTSESSDEPDFDSGLKGAQGFQTSQFPAARFVTTKFVLKSATSYEAQGTLTIRGIARDVTLPFTLAIEGRTAHMTGTAHVLRTDFGLGQGEWAAPSPVAHDVSITIDLFATQ